jgi:hypothetical protein
MPILDWITVFEKKGSTLGESIFGFSIPTTEFGFAKEF